MERFNTILGYQTRRELRQSLGSRTIRRQGTKLRGTRKPRARTALFALMYRLPVKPRYDRRCVGCGAFSCRRDATLDPH